MRLLSLSVLLSGVSVTLAAGDGKCIPAAAGWTTYAALGGTSVNWFTELTLTAVDIKIRSNTLPTTATLLQTAITNAYAAAAAPAPAGILYGATAVKNANLNNALTNYADCATCTLEYVADVAGMYTNKTLPVDCQTKVGLTVDKCMYALAPAVIKFNTCTGALTNDFGSALTVLSPTGGRCTPKQIMDLDGQYNLFKSLVNKALFATVNAGFDAAYQALPCRKVIDDWLTGFTVANKNAMKIAGVCGIVESGSEILSDNCKNIQIGANPADTVGAYFTTLADQLGGGFTIPVGADAGLRCTSDQKTILSQMGSFGGFMKCSIAGDALGAAPAPENWRICMNTYWPSLGDILLGGNSYACATKFTTLAKTVKDNFGAGAGRDFPDCTDTTVFSTNCINELTSNGFFDRLNQQTGVRLTSVQPTCTTGQIGDFSAMVKSIIPFIVLARSINADSTLTDATQRMAAAMKGLADLPGFASVNSTMPCLNCFGGLVGALANKMSSDVNFKNACGDEYSTGCTGYDFVATIISDFKDCSGITLTTTTGYVCDDNQYDLIVSNNITRNLFSSAVSIGSNATIASVMLKIITDVKSIEEANKLVLPCANCLRDMVTGFFGLSDTNKRTCLASPAVCVTLVDVMPIINKFITCAGHSFDVDAIAASITPVNPDTPGGSNSTNTTKQSYSPIGFGVATLIGALASILVL